MITECLGLAEAGEPNDKDTDYAEASVVSHPPADSLVNVKFDE